MARILILRTGAMGDILHALPAVAALRAALPDTHIGWVVEPHWLPLLASTTRQPLVDDVHLAPTRAWKRRPFALQTARQILTLRQQIKAAKYEVVIDLQGSLRSAVLGSFAGAPRFLGSAAPREQIARRFYTEPVTLTQPHVIQQACELVSAACALPLEPAPVTLPQDPEAEAWCDRTPATHRPFVLLAPTAGWGAKQWPAKLYAELAHHLHERGWAVIVNAAPGDATAHSIKQTSPAAELSCTVAQLIALTRRAALVIGGDTGPIHLAAALARPTLALFGPTDPARTGALAQGAPTRNLRHASSLTSHKRLPTPDPGLKSITVDEVLTAALTLLSQSK